MKGPYEFPKLPTRALTGSSSDSFPLVETPQVPTPKPKVTASVSSLGHYHTLIRRTLYGTITVVRRKDFAPIQFPAPVRLPQYQARGRPQLRRQEARVHELLSYNYMDNRRYWDNINAKKPQQSHKLAYRKSRSLQSLPHMPDTPPKSPFRPRRSLTKSWVGIGRLAGRRKQC